MYSTFLQRSYDQILHDVCLNRFPVTFAIDRAGIVGSDGETHQGIFDISYLTHIPGLVVMAPKNGIELKEMLEFCLAHPSPTAIRYPRGMASQTLIEFQAPVKCGECEWIAKEGEILLLAVGSMVETADKVRKLLEQEGSAAALVNVRFLSPIDETMITAALSYKIVVTLEENIARGGFGEQMAGELLRRAFTGKFLSVALPNQFIEHGSQEELKKAYGLDAESIIARLKEIGISRSDG